MEKQEEAGSSGGARCGEFGVSLSLKPTVLEPFRILCLFLTPTRESTQQQSHRGILPNGRLHWDATRLPGPRLVHSASCIHSVQSCLLNKRT